MKRSLSSPSFLLLPLLVLPIALAAAAEERPLPKKLPAGLQANIFAAPPLVNYPTFVAPAANGDLYVSVDKNGSLDTKPDRGFIYKLVDTDHDGVADKQTVFADKVTSPRGLTVVGDRVICLHPPELEMFRDKDGDGVAEERKVLIKGIGFDLSKRAPDHTSNGATLGIDGWIYLAMGDFGFMEAEGTDGAKLQLRGGGVVRVKPDGTGMELYARGTRNIYEVAVDPWLNLFARDNTNDGGGWDTRLEYYLGGVDLGYPRKFKHFTDETFPVLGIYGGGSGVGGVYVQEKGFGWPAGYDDALYTCDWGRSAVFRHSLTDSGASFTTTQDTLLELERVTDMKMDALGNAYVSSWKGATFSYTNENVGYVVRVSASKPTDKKPDLNFAKKVPDALVGDLVNPNSHMLRIAAQQEILQRNDAAGFSPLLEKAATTGDSLPGRIAAMFTYKQLNKAKATPLLVKLAADPKVKEFAIRALADVPAEGAEVPTALLVGALKDSNDHVRAQAVIALGRLGRKEAAAAILPIASQAKEIGSKAEPEPRAKVGNIKKASPGRCADVEADLTDGKMVYLVVTDSGDGNGLDHANWMEPHFVSAKGDLKLTDLKWKSATQGWGVTNVNKSTTGSPLMVDGKSVTYGIGTHAVSVIAYDIPAGVTKFVAKGGLDDAGCKQGDGGSVLFQVYVDALPAIYEGKQSNEEEVYTDTTRALTHVASQSLIKLNAAEVCLKALDSEPSQHSAALRVLRQLHTPEAVTGLIDRLGKATDATLQKGLVTALVRLVNDEGVWDASSWGTRPDTTGPYYKRDAWSETPRLEKALSDYFAKADAPGKAHMTMELNRHRVQIKGLAVVSTVADPQWAKDQGTLAKAMGRMADMKPKDIGNMEQSIAIEKALAHLETGKPDAKSGKKVFEQQGCVACHVVGKKDAPKGPNLYDIAQRYKAKEIIDSILNPSATVSQGFPTHTVTTKDGQLYSGFAIKEAGDEIVIRNMAAMTSAIPTASISKHEKSEHVSSMTPGLVNNITPEALGDMVFFFQTLK